MHVLVQARAHHSVSTAQPTSPANCACLCCVVWCGCGGMRCRRQPELDLQIEAAEAKTQEAMERLFIVHGVRETPAVPSDVLSAVLCCAVLCCLLCRAALC